MRAKSVFGLTKFTMVSFSAFGLNCSAAWIECCGVCHVGLERALV